VVRGIRAAAAGLILVMVFMVVYYRLSGSTPTWRC
jgi:preprotein translocase subunit SecD